MRAIYTIVTFWIPYLLPSIVAWFRRRHGKSTIMPMSLLFFANLFLGWTVLVWFVCMANALGYNPVAWVVLKFGGLIAGGGPAAPPAPLGDPAPSGGPTVCGMCQGSGTLTCSQCGGRGSWYEQPQTATGVAQLRTCPACVSSGRIRCTYCGGSGQRA